MNFKMERGSEKTSEFLAAAGVEEDLTGPPGEVAVGRPRRCQDPRVRGGARSSKGAAGGEKNPPLSDAFPQGEGTSTFLVQTHRQTVPYVARFLG